MSELQNTEIIESTSQQDSLLSVIERVASDPNSDVGKMEKLLDMQERIFDKQNEIAFNNAMMLAQKEMPAIAKKAVNNQTNSSYAKHEHIIAQCSPIWTKHGFSLSFGTDQSPIEGYIRVTCLISHNAGHKRKEYYDLPLDSAGIKGNTNKTGIHASASTLTYGRRYLTCLIFNLATFDDNDGNMPKNIEYINEEQAADLDALIDEVEADKEKFLQWCKCDSIDKIPVTKFKACIKALEAKRK